MLGPVPTEVRAQRQFLPADFVLNTWDDLKHWLDQLLAEKPQTADELAAWWRRVGEVFAAVDEEGSRRYIRMTCNSSDEDLVQAYTDFVQDLHPRLQPLEHQLQRKLWDHPQRPNLDPERFGVMLRQVENSLSLYREENVPLITEAEITSQEFGKLSGKLSVELEGKTLTLQQAGAYLHRHDRPLREQVWRKIQAARAEKRQAYEELFDQLVDLRHQIAQHAGFSSFSSYQFRALGRVDYQPEQVAEFRASIAQVATPRLTQLRQHHQRLLGLDSLRPWDTQVNPYAKVELRPFETGRELARKGVEVFQRLDPKLADILQELDRKGHLDLDSRLGKSPGGYNCSLHETGLPFIFMNAAGTQQDLETLVHEAGHAFHSVYTHNLPYLDDRQFPSEIAELASMSMELLTMDHWDVFYPDPEHLRLARIDQLSRSYTILPWIAIIDAFQQWVYDHPKHTREQRAEQWVQLHQHYSGSGVDWSGLEEYRRSQWHRQLHLFEVPFYYIEYGIAQLGALQLYRNYRQDPQQALAQYREALKLGYTRPLPELYAAAGVRFDFSAELLEDLFQFLETELRELGGLD